MENEVYSICLWNQNGRYFSNCYFNEKQLQNEKDVYSVYSVKLVAEWLDLPSLAINTIVRTIQYYRANKEQVGDESNLVKMIARNINKKPVELSQASK